MPDLVDNARVPTRSRLGSLSTLLHRWFKPPLGTRGERAAARHLKRAGYRILGRNIRCRLGEVDLLAQTPDGGTLVIVEVKTSAPTLPDKKRIRPEVRVNRQKQRRLTALAGYILKRYHLQGRPVRFDVIGVDLPPHDKPTIRHHQNAFESHV